MGLLSEFWPHIAALGAFIVTAIGIYTKGRTDANKKHHIEELENAHETHERIDGVDLSGDDSEWLRDRAKR